MFNVLVRSKKIVSERFIPKVKVCVKFRYQDRFYQTILGKDKWFLG